MVVLQWCHEFHTYDPPAQLSSGDLLTATQGEPGHQHELALGGRAVRSGVAGPDELRRRRRRGHVVAVQVVAAVPPPESPRGIAVPADRAGIGARVVSELAVDLAAPATGRRLAVHLLRVDLAATLGPDQGRPGGAGVEPRAAGGP